MGHSPRKKRNHSRSLGKYQSWSPCNQPRRENKVGFDPFWEAILGIEDDEKGTQTKLSRELNRGRCTSTGKHFGLRSSWQWWFQRFSSPRGCLWPTGSHFRVGDGNFWWKR